jgi:hypothetical protein
MDLRKLWFGKVELTLGRDEAMDTKEIFDEALEGLSKRRFSKTFFEMMSNQGIEEMKVKVPTRALPQLSEEARALRNTMTNNMHETINDGMDPADMTAAQEKMGFLAGIESGVITYQLGRAC